MKEIMSYPYSRSHSARIFRYSSRALSYASLAVGCSFARILAEPFLGSVFSCQHLSMAFRHHSAERLLVRIGFSPTRTNTGLVWLEGKILRQTQLLSLMGTSKVTSCSEPSASISFLSTAWPLTTTSTGTFRVAPIRARSISQYGF